MTQERPAWRNRAEARCEVLVIGGGPAGSTISRPARAAGARRRAARKDRATRASTSASRCCRSTCRCSSAWAWPRRSSAIGMPKYGVEFVSPWHDKPVDASISRMHGTRPIRPPTRCAARSSTTILFRNAVRRGARAIEGCRVTAGRISAPTARDVSARQEDGGERTWRTRFVVDASGRDTFLANRFGFKQRDRKHNSAAIFGHFSGARRACRASSEGNIIDLLVRPRLVLVHPADRRRHQRRRGVLALLHEVAQDRAAAVPARHDRALPGAGRAPAATPS